VDFGAAMQYRRVGKWGLNLPEIALGLWHNFGGTAPLERSREIIRATPQATASANDDSCSAGQGTHNRPVSKASVA
jgi:hypothetical protein